MSLRVMIDTKVFNLEDVKTMEAFLADDRAKVSNFQRMIQQYANDPDIKAGLQEDRDRLKKRIDVTTRLLTLVKG